MRQRVMGLAVAAAATWLAACAHTIPVAGAPPEATSASVSQPRQGPRWTTRLRSVAPTHLDSGDSTRHTSYGSAQWTPGNSPALSVVHLQITYTGTERDLSWAILYGNCGAASMSVIPLSGFPEIDLSAGGNAEITVQVSTEFPLSGQYRIEVYKDRVGGEQAVVACGEMKYSSS